MTVSQQDASDKLPDQMDEARIDTTKASTEPVKHSSQAFPSLVETNVKPSTPGSYMHVTPGDLF